MLKALWTAASGMLAMQSAIDTTSNNLANVNTAGFKKKRLESQDLFYQTYREAGGTAGGEGIQYPTSFQVGSGTRPVATPTLFSQGDMQATDNPLDIAIEGNNGLFQVRLPDDTFAYTRAGNFKLDANGNLVTNDGYKLQPEIVIPADASDISITGDGTVSVRLLGESVSSVVGNIQTFKFVNPAGLKSLGHTLFAETVASGVPVSGTPGTNGLGALAQGMLEMSNVKVVEEMVRLIVDQRAYEINSKSVQTADDMVGTVNNLKR